MVKEAWTRRIWGFPMFQVVKKLYLAKQALKEWQRQKPDINTRINKARNKAQMLQEKLQADPMNTGLLYGDKATIDNMTKCLFIEEC